MKKRILLLTGALVLCASLLLGVTQTGNLIMLVSTEDGQTLPGASVVISSKVLMGTRTQVTAANGKAMFRRLPPGKYQATVTMPGFKTMQQSDIWVRIQKTTTATAKLELGEARETVFVIDQAPIVDTKSNTVAVDFNFEHYINHMPTYRHFTSVGELAGGAVDGNNPSVFGSGGYDNLYLIDGVSQTDPTTQTWGSQFNMDAVADMSVQTAGVSVEYGMMMGAVMNIVTKSGSNEFHGLGRLQMQRTEWNDVSEYNPDTTADNAQAGRSEDRWDISGGGPLYPDTLWFYTGYTRRFQERGIIRYSDPFNPTVSTPDAYYYHGHFWNFKATAQMGEDIKVVFFFNEDPINIPGIGGGPSRDGARVQPESDWLQYQAGTTYQVAGSWVLSEASFAEGRWNRSRDNLDTTPNPDNPDTPKAEPLSDPNSWYYYSTDGWKWNGMRYLYQSARNYDLGAGAFNVLVDTDSFGEHDIKIGGEYLDQWQVRGRTYYPGGGYIYHGPVNYVGFDNAVQWTKMEYYAPDGRIPPIEVHNKYLQFYVQDSVTLTDAVTVNLGVRAEDISSINFQDEEIHHVNLLSTMAPRVGVAVDLDGHALHFSAARYYDALILYLPYAFSSTIAEYRNYYRPLDYGSGYKGRGNGRNGWSSTPYKTRTYGGAEPPHSLDPDLTPQYMDELTAGFDYLLSDSMAVGVNVIFRQYRDRVTEADWREGDGFHSDDSIWYYENWESDYKGTLWKQHFGVVVDFRKRPTEDNLFLKGSLTYGYSEGLNHQSYEDAFGTNISEAPEYAENWWGQLSWPSLIARVQATYFFPNNWYFGAQFHWNNGYLYTSVEEQYFAAADEYYNVFPNGRGDMGRAEDNYWNVDLQFGVEQEIEFPFEIPFTDNNVLFGLYVNVINLLCSESVTDVENDLDSSLYGIATGWRSARSYELGFRLEL